MGFSRHDLGSAALMEGATLAAIVGWLASDPAPDVRIWPYVVGGMGIAIFVVGLIMLAVGGAGAGARAALGILVPGAVGSGLLLLAGRWFARGGCDGMAWTSRIAAALPLVPIVVMFVLELVARIAGGGRPPDDAQTGT